MSQNPSTISPLEAWIGLRGRRLVDRPNAVGDRHEGQFARTVVPTGPKLVMRNTRAEENGARQPTKCVHGCPFFLSGVQPTGKRRGTATTRSRRQCGNQR